MGEDLPEKQHAGLAFSLQGSLKIISYPQDQYLQTGRLLAVSNKYGHVFIAKSDSIIHTPTRNLHEDLNDQINFSTLSILV